MIIWFSLYVLLIDFWICFVKVSNGWLIVIKGIWEGFRCLTVESMILMVCVIIVREWTFSVNIGSKDIKVEKWDDSDDFEVRYIVYDIMFFFVSFRLLRICLLLFN